MELLLRFAVAFSERAKGIGKPIRYRYGWATSLRLHIVSLCLSLARHFALLHKRGAHKRKKEGVRAMSVRVAGFQLEAAPIAAAAATAARWQSLLTLRIFDPTSDIRDTEPSISHAGSLPWSLRLRNFGSNQHPPTQGHPTQGAHSCAAQDPRSHVCLARTSVGVPGRQTDRQRQMLNTGRVPCGRFREAV